MNLGSFILLQENTWIGREKKKPTYILDENSFQLAEPVDDKKLDKQNSRIIKFVESR